MPEQHVEEALWGCLQYVIGHASNAEAVIACCQRLSRCVECHAADIALIRILQGRLDDAEPVFNELPPAVREARSAQTGLASTRGLIALLRGDDLAARREIDAALAAEKADTRKRHVFPYHFTFAISLLALVRMDPPESTALLTQLMHSAESRRVERELEVWLAAASLGDLFEEADLASNTSWLKLRRERDSAHAFEPELPSTLQAELRPCQVGGYFWLARLSRLRAGVRLADDMGLGKTVQSLAVLLERAPGGPALVVAPTSVVANWVDEARRSAPTLNVKMYTGGVVERAGLLGQQTPSNCLWPPTGLCKTMSKKCGRSPGIAWSSTKLRPSRIRPRGGHMRRGGSMRSSALSPPLPRYKTT